MFLFVVILVFVVPIFTVERMKLSKGRAKKGRVSSLGKLGEKQLFIVIMGKNRKTNDVQLLCNPH